MPKQNHDTLYAVWKARDRRYDGKVFIGVRTTGIYCRPICPAKTPLQKNVDFYPTSAAAEEAGFRPCMRCRPESSPGTPAWMGTSATVARALKLIAADANEQPRLDVSSLAHRLGVGERQLHRLFVEHLGAPPIAIIKTRKLDLARKLLDETSLPISEIAFAAGFESIRRFNDAFRDRFKKTPSQARQKISQAQPMGKWGAANAVNGANTADTLTLQLPFRPPLDWESLLGFLRDRAIPGVESCDADSYTRTFALAKGAPSWFRVQPSPLDGMLELHLPLRMPASDLLQILARVRRLLDLDADPSAISEHLRKNTALKKIIARHPGLRVPGAWDGFEIAVRAVLGQQVSVASARTLAQRIVLKYGKSHVFENTAELTHLFPTPQTLSKATVDDFASMGIVRTRAQTLRELSLRISEGRLTLDPSQNMEQIIEELRTIPGIGEWTAAYISMRVLGNSDALLKTDLLVKRALAAQPGGTFEPWGSYATLYFWKAAGAAKPPAAAAKSPTPSQPKRKKNHALLR